MKLRDGVLLVILVLLFVILAYLISGKNPKRSFLAPLILPIRGWFGGYGGHGGNTTVVVGGGSSSSSSSSSSGGSESSPSSPSTSPTIPTIPTVPITIPGPGPGPIPPIGPFTLMGYN